MADFVWNFRANTRTAQTGAKHVNELSRSVRNLDASAQGNTKKLKLWQQEWVKLLGVWNTVNKAIDFAVKRLRQMGAAFTYVFRNVMKFGMEFEKTEVVIRGFLQNADPVIEKVRDIARNSQFTARQVGEAAVALIRAGREFTNVAKSGEELEAVLGAAAANAVGLGKAANIGAVMQKMFNVELREGLEILTAGARTAPTTFTEIASAMRNVGPIAKQLRMDMTDTTAVLANLAATTGEVGGRAGTRVQIMLRRLAALTPIARKRIEQLGIVLEDSQGKFLPLTMIIDQFNQRLKGIASDSERAAIMKDIFGRAFSSVIPLINAGGAALSNFTRRITDARDAMDRLQKMRAESLTGVFMRWKSAIEEFWLTMKDILNARIVNYFQAATTAVNRMSDAFKEFGKTGDWKQLFNDIVAALTGFKDELVKMFEEIKPIFLEFLDELGPDLLAKAIEVGETVGAGLLKGIWKGIRSIGTRIVESLDEVINHSGSVAWELIKMANEKGLRDFGFTKPGTPGGESGGAGATVPLPKPPPVISPTEKAQNWKRIVEEGKKAVDKMREEQTKQVQEQSILDTQEGKRLELKEEALRLWEKTSFAIKEAGVTFQKWLLEPIDEFKRATLSVMQTFDKVRSDLTTKLIGVQEKFGMISGMSAAKQRLRLQKVDLGTLQQRLGLAQGPGERQGIFEQLAQAAEGIGEVTTGRQRRFYGGQSRRYLRQAMKEAEEQQKIELEKIRLDKEFAQESIQELTKMRGGAGTAGAELEIVKQLEQNMKSLGDVIGATKLQADIRDLSIKAAGEQSQKLQDIWEVLSETFTQNGDNSDKLLGKLDEVIDNFPVEVNEELTTP